MSCRVPRGSSPFRRGAGVAQSLLRAANEAACADASDAMWRSMWEYNGRAQPFYEKCDYRHVDTKACIVGTDEQTDWVRVRAISHGDAPLGEGSLP